MTSPPVNGVNGVSNYDSGRLQVLVVGAGIAGLSAAIGLRQQGHYVQVFEQSSFAREAGAAIHIAPNASGILQRLGLRTEDLEANKMERVGSLSTKFRFF
jgi:2-polyprenyl-6-methoxyphenol hydroxylase-like FAD-dependent oxidoreductase